MNKLLSVLILLFAIPALSQANESMSDIARGKAFASNVSSTITQLQDLRGKRNFEDVIELAELSKQNTLEAYRAQGGDEEQLAYLEDEIDNQIAMYRAIGDADTVLEMQIATLQEAQTSSNLMFMFTKINVRCLASSGCYMSDRMRALIATPFAIAIDIALLPLTFIASAATGF